MRRRAYLAAAGTGVASLSGCLGVLGTGGATCDEGCSVGMASNAYLPREYAEATVGEPVVWVNTSSRGHTVTAYEDAIPAGATYFASGGYGNETAAREGWDADLGGRLDPGEEYEHTFEEPGEYGYFCIPHERTGMVGTIVVSE
ncbi:halocyanin [Halobacteriales archaeon SW_7_68_16]|nr:MAG: halocyanin [Halobacteriales archaeon SW_7_68_16]